MKYELLTQEHGIISVKLNVQSEEKTLCIWRQSKMESFHIIGTVAKIKFSKIYSHIKITVKVKFHGDFYNAIIFQVDTKTGKRKI